VLDSAIESGTLPGALLRTSVAQQENARYRPGRNPIAATLLPPSADTIRKARSAPTLAVVHAEGTRTVVALRGATDISARPVLCDVLSRVIASGAGDVVIDLTRATFIDTATVRVLATTQRLLDHQGRNLAFRSPSRLTASVLDLFGLAGLIETSEPIHRDHRRLDGDSQPVSTIRPATKRERSQSSTSE